MNVFRVLNSRFSKKNSPCKFHPEFRLYDMINPATQLYIGLLPSHMTSVRFCYPAKTQARFSHTCHVNLNCVAAMEQAFFVRRPHRLRTF